MRKSIALDVEAFAKDLDMRALTPGRGSVVFTSPEINRPGLQFTGYYVHFQEKRVQLVGNAEIGYLYDLPQTQLEACAARFMRAGIPCIVCGRGKEPPPVFMKAAREYGVPVFVSALPTGELGSRITMYLAHKLAPQICVHGVMLDVFGVGTLLRGPSGIGKSETALEMVKNGHTLVADDVVQLRRIADALVASAPEATRNMIEIRGVGLMDVRHLYGVGAVQPEKNLDMVLDLELWSDKTAYKRMEAEERTEDILGVQVSVAALPVSPGRNLASIIGVAARSFRLKKLGYSLEFLPVDP